MYAVDSVWDSDSGGSELIAQLCENFNRIDQMKNKTTGYRWWNLYGAHEYKSKSFLGEVVNTVASAVTKEAKKVICVIFYFVYVYIFISSF